MTAEITLVEVGPRDGLQNESHFVDTQTKIEFINQLSTTGLSRIEVTSFVSAKAIPALADHAEVLAGIQRHADIDYSVLVPNAQGYASAKPYQANTLSVFTAASNGFCQHNIGCDIADSLSRFAEFIPAAKASGYKIRGYISCIFACPYEGKIAPAAVVEVAEKLSAMGVDEISLGDTIGVGTITEVHSLLNAIQASVPATQTAVHFHNTYGQAIANIVAALEHDIRIIDTAVAGLGGCPYAKGATGNVATEDVVYCLEGLGLSTGIDLAKLLSCGELICQALSKRPDSFLAQAGLPAWR